MPVETKKVKAVKEAKDAKDAKATKEVKAPKVTKGSRVAPAQVQKAVNALLTYSQKKKKEAEQEGKTLFADEEENLWLVVTTKTMPGGKLSLKPQRIPLPHPPTDPRQTPICLITKDPQRAYKDLIAKNDIKFISRVVGISKLKGKFGHFEAKRQLAGEYGIFLADERVLPLLPGLLGKSIMKRRKPPTPVNLLKKNLKAELEAAVSSTNLHRNLGTSTSLRIGHTGMDSKKLIENVLAAIEGVVWKMHAATLRPGKDGKKWKPADQEEEQHHRELAWQNIQSLGIKTHSSICLPIWSVDLAQRWEVPVPPSSASRASTKHSPSDKPERSLPGDDGDTMSEGEEEELSQRMKKSAISKPSSTSSGTSSTEQSKVKKRKLVDAMDEDEDHPKVQAESSVSSKKKKKHSNVASKGDIMDVDTIKPSTFTSAASSSKTISKSWTKDTESKKSKDKDHASEKISTSTSSLPKAAITANGNENGNKKAERARAVDFMDEDENAAAIAPKVKEKAKGTENAPEDAIKKKKKKGGKEVDTVNGSTSTPPIEPTPVPSSATTTVTTTTTTTTTASAASATSPKATPTALKSAMKKASTGGSLTPAELQQKKARKTSFSVVEKKKEKLGERASLKTGGKSKQMLVGRGPKM